jgi:hydroxymethylpyrimidine pyrophosphatase-like HAD family hydrolase
MLEMAHFSYAPTTAADEVAELADFEIDASERGILGPLLEK